MYYAPQSEKAQYLDFIIDGSDLSLFNTGVYDFYTFDNPFEIDLNSKRFVLSLITEFNTAVAVAAQHNFFCDIWTLNDDDTFIPGGFNLAHTISWNKLGASISMDTVVCSDALPSVNRLGGSSPGIGFTPQMIEFYNNIAQPGYPMSTAYQNMTTANNVIANESTMFPYWARDKIFLFLGFTNGAGTGLQILRTKISMVEI